MLSKLRIVNFQSIADIEYEFIDGLNVIVAPNNVGKSIINKVIELIVNFDKTSSEKVKQYITFGKSKSDIYVSSETEDFWIEIYLKKINYYKFNGNSYEFVGNHLPNDLKSVLGLLVCEDNFIGNLITANHSKLLVDPDDKINTQTLGLVTKDHEAELIIDTCEERLKVINSNIREMVSVRDSLEREYQKVEVVDITRVENAVNRVYSSIDFMDNLVRVAESLENVQPKGLINKEIGKILEFTSVLENSLDKLSNVSNLKELKVSQRQLDIVAELVNLDRKLDEILYRKNLINSSKPVRFNENLLGLMSRLEIMQANLNKVTVTKNLELNKLNSLKDLLELNSSIENLLDLNQKNNLLIQKSVELKKELDSYKGEVYSCPIYGSIKLVNEECIRINN